jgi:undecaprenyl-diphosphatase
MITSSDKKQLIQGELADLALYQSLRTRAKGEFAQTLDELVKTETRHAAFWKSAFKMEEIDTPGFAGSARNAFIRLNVTLFGEAAGYLFLEAVESHGIKHYLQLWKKMEGDPARDGLRQILTEELEHEDMIATGGERTVDPDLIRNAFLGFNDGSVEILGAVSGLAAALGSPALIAGTLVGAGALLWWSQRKNGQTLINDITWTQAILIGISQGLAIIPGISRSGVTISTALLLGIEKSAAVRFSFYLSMPIIFGAGILKIKYLAHNLSDPALTVGVLVSAISGFFAIHLLITHVRNKSFTPFVIYRFALAAVVVVWLAMNLGYAAN